jgi:hypothetical protein
MFFSLIEIITHFGAVFVKRMPEAIEEVVKASL